MTTQVTSMPAEQFGASTGGTTAAAPPPPAEATRPEPSLRRMAMRGAMWTAVGYAGANVIRLAGNLVFTRALYPQAFGLMALINVFLIGLQMFSDLGIGPSIIQHKRGDDRDFVDTAWTVQVVRGVILWLAACAFAWPAARFYGEPSLVWYIPVAALSSLVNGFQHTSLYSLNRRLALGRLTLIELGSQGTMTVAMIVLTLVTHSVWSLVVGSVVNSVVMLILSHWIATDRARFRWDPESAKSILSFGRTVFLSTLVLFLANQSERMILGRYASLEMLGIYSVAYVLARMGTLAVIGLASRVLFPSFAKMLREDEARAARQYARTSMYVNGASLASLVALVALGPWLIRLMYDPRYWGAGVILQVLAVQSVFETMRSPANYLLMAAGRPGFGVWAWAARAVVLFVGLPLAFKFGTFHTAVWVVALSTFPPAVIFAYGIGRVLPSLRRREALGCAATTATALLIYWIFH